MKWNDFIQTPAIGWSDPLITGAKLLALAILTEWAIPQGGGRLTAPCPACREHR